MMFAPMPMVASDRDGQTGPRSHSLPRSGTPLGSHTTAAPELGSEVEFRRSPTHHPERGFVRSRQFGTGIIDVIDMRAKVIRLMPDQYRAVAENSTFACPIWPDCGCPDGAVRSDCPGLCADATAVPPAATGVAVRPPECHPRKYANIQQVDGHLMIAAATALCWLLAASWAALKWLF